MDNKRLGGILERVGAGVSMFNNDAQVRQSGYNRIGDIRAREDAQMQAEAEAEKEARTVAQKIKLKVLDSSLQALQRPDLTEEQRAAIADDVTKLGTDLGVDVSPYLNIPAAQPALKSKVGQQFSDRSALVRQFGEGSPEVLKFDETAAGTQKKTTSEFERGLEGLPPAERERLQRQRMEKLATPRTANGSQPVWSERKAIAAEDRYEKAKTKYATGSLQDQGKLYLEFINREVDGGRMSLGEAASRRKAFETSINGMKQFDRQYAKIDEILQRTPVAGTVGGKLAESFMGLATNVLGVMSQLTPDFMTDTDFTPAFEEYADDLREVGINTQELQRAVYAIALTEAAANGLANDGRMSNYEMQQAIKDIAASGTTPGKLYARLKGARETMAARVQDRLQTGLGDFSGVSMEDPIQKPQAPASIGGATGGWSVRRKTSGGGN